jgi:hypothetical protein
MPTWFGSAAAAPRKLEIVVDYVDHPVSVDGLCA